MIEDYLLVPCLLGGVVKVPGLLTVVVLLGAVLLGVIARRSRSPSPPPSCWS